jgi:glycosyltransferase involved in cell wall biosynthesis
MIPQFVQHHSLAKKALRNSQHVLAVSQRVARFVDPFNATPQILPYGVPDEIGMSAVHDRAEFPIVFSIVGTIESRKGQDIFIKAAIELEKKAPGTAQFNIIGRTPDILWAAKLKAMACGHENIRFLGELDFNTCLDAMQSSDVIVCPSRDDPLPMVVTDGLSMGKPVICSDATGHADFITPGVDGMIVRSESVEDLADAMHRLLQNPTLRKDMGAAARKTFLSHFSEQVFAERINKLVQTEMI